MAVLNIIISIPLAKTFGPVGSALGTAIGLIFANGIVMNIYYQKGLGMDMISFWKSILSLSKGMIIPAVLGFGIMKKIVFKRIDMYLIMIVLYSLVYFGSMWFLGMNREEKELILRPLRSIKNKSRRE